MHFRAQGKQSCRWDEEEQQSSPEYLEGRRCDYQECTSKGRDEAEVEIFEEVMRKVWGFSYIIWWKRLLCIGSWNLMYTKLVDFSTHIPWLILSFLASWQMFCFVKSKKHLMNTHIQQVRSISIYLIRCTNHNCISDQNSYVWAQTHSIQYRLLREVPFWKKLFADKDYPWRISYSGYGS